MIEDVYEPLEEYRKVFRDRFSTLAKEKFKELTVLSKVDVVANRGEVKIIRKLESALRRAKLWRFLIGFLMLVSFAGAVAAVVAEFAEGFLEGSQVWQVAAGGAAALALGIWMIFVYRRSSAKVKALESELEEAMKRAWAQMAPLNELYTWDMTVSLIEKTVPRLEFDKFFSAKRLEDLSRIYDWDDSFNDGKSITFAQSGVINGNPFVLGEYLTMKWGEKTYEGTKTISYYVTERDEKGRSHRVRRTEVLHAYVTKPIPVYYNDKVLLYGNDAAPNLTFTHEPSGLDDQDIFDGIRERMRLRELKKKSRNLDDDSNFTLMTNHEFEAWFKADDRNDEVEFRLLFTALAQTQMMALMKDLKTGYGDDFVFAKDRKINYLKPRHLDDLELETDPAIFRSWDYDAAKKKFQEYNENYFRAVYFALAPVLAIPLYQQTRTHEDIWKGVIAGESSSFWEHESMANCYGDECFKHPSAITPSILKTRVVRRVGSVSDVVVTAYGYKGIKQVDYEDVYGGDGKWHSVPVEWTEYLPVERSSGMQLSESPSPSADFTASYKESRAALYRRTIYSYLQSLT